MIYKEGNIKKEWTDEVLKGENKMEDNKIKESGFGIGEIGAEVFENSQDTEPKKGIKKDGQLWEECECGNEPVYLPLHLCSSCWPK